MLPVGDDRYTGGRAPVLTLTLVAVNAVVFLLELSQPSPSTLQSMVQAWGVVPREYSMGRDLAPEIGLPFWTTVLTSMFLHGGWGHLLGNMLYLWIFGENVESVLGHARFLAFYLVCGLAAAATHILGNPGSAVPTVGASGAISGVLGGYLLLFPRNRVRILTHGGMAAVPAALMLGAWVLIQLANGFGAVARTPETGGVAYLAHVGGFVAGTVLVAPMVRGRRPALADLE